MKKEIVDDFEYMGLSRSESGRESRVQPDLKK